MSSKLQPEVAHREPGATVEKQRAHWLCWVAGLYALIGGAISLAGWALDINVLTDWIHSGISIQPNASLCVLISGIALILIALGRPAAGAIVGAVVGLIALLTAFEWIAGTSLGIDSVLMFGRTWGRIGVLVPGRMGPPGALCWSLIGISFALNCSRFRRLVPVLALCTLAVSLLSITSYVYGASLLYTLPRSTIIALQTATFIAATCVGLCAGMSDLNPALLMTERSGAGMMARRAVPVILLLPLSIGALRLLGERAGLFDLAFGSTIRTEIETVVLAIAFWWSLRSVRAYEVALRGSQTQARIVLESITDAVVTVDAQWRYLYVNATAEKLLGKDSDSMLGRTILEVFPELGAGETLAYLQQVVDSGRSMEFESFSPVVRRWHAHKAYPVPGGGVAIYFHDVTDRIEAEELAHVAQSQLENELANAHLLAKSSTEMISEGDDQALFEMMLQTAVQLLDSDCGTVQGYDPESNSLKLIASVGFDVESARSWDNVREGSPGTSGMAWRKRERVIIQDVDATPEFEGTAKLATYHATGIKSVQSTPLFTRSGVIVGVISTHWKFPHVPSDHALSSMDVLARQAADLAEIRQSEQAKVTAAKNKDEFLATLAHELRNPLAPIRHSLAILEARRDDAEASGLARETIDRQVTHMVRLVDDLLDVSRISSNRLELKCELLDLKELVSQVVSAGRPELVSHELSLQVSLPEEEIKLYADPVRLAQILGNLLSNSCKYTPAGGRIEVTVIRDGGSVEIAVRDTGLGIARNMLESVFELFTQEKESIEHSGSGLGIGLSLVRRLVELHGGTIVARSEGKGRGSEFCVRLPAPVAEEAYTENITTPPPSVSIRRVLVVDDSVDNARALSLLLQLDGHETTEAHDGHEAIRVAEEFRPEVVLLDIGLPFMDGYDVCRQLRAQEWGRDITIVALTGWGQVSDRQKSADAGFTGHLVKPADRKDVLAFIARSELQAK